jgi:hypothetical protein
VHFAAAFEDRIPEFPPHSFFARVDTTCDPAHKFSGSARTNSRFVPRGRTDLPALTPVIFCRGVSADKVSGPSGPVVLIGTSRPFIETLLRLTVSRFVVVLTMALREFSTTPRITVPAGRTVLPPALRSLASFVLNGRPGDSCDDSASTVVTTTGVPGGIVAASEMACTALQTQRKITRYFFLFMNTPIRAVLLVLPVAD